MLALLDGKLATFVASSETPLFCLCLNPTARPLTLPPDFVILRGSSTSWVLMRYILAEVTFLAAFLSLFPSPSLQCLLRSPFLCRDVLYAFPLTIARFAVAALSFGECTTMV